MGKLVGSIGEGVVFLWDLLKLRKSVENEHTDP